MSGSAKDTCIANKELCGDTTIAAQVFAIFQASITFLAQFIGYSVGNNWMPHPYMKQRPKIWRIRLKILVYLAALMTGIGALCGLAAMSIWNGVQSALLDAAKSGFKCDDATTCPRKSVSYYLIGMAVFINASATAVFFIQPRFFGRKFNVFSKLKEKIFGKKKKKKRKKIGALSDM